MQRCMGCMELMQEELSCCPICGYRKDTPPKEAYHMQPGSILQYRYIVGRVLGYGGFGVTYIGFDAQLERKVAIKEFLPSACATRMPGNTEVTVYSGEATRQFQAGLNRFTDEAKRLAAFNHVPGIVDIYDTFEENNTAYIAMQYLQGEDVKAILEKRGTFLPNEALSIVVSVCETLIPVHESGMIHRDISPDNIFITTEGEVKVLDFGASRFATGVNSKSLSVILKAGYAPEEQYRTKGNQGPWTDVYALAATFYKMMTGITPVDSMERSVKDTLQEPSKLGVQLSVDLENALMNALNLRMENRTQSMEAFKEAVTGGQVARIKEKQTRKDNGRLPVWGSVLVAGSIFLVLILGCLTVTGVIDFGQGNLLADTFGTGVPEGYINAPGVVNQLEEEAQAAVKEAGLDYLVVGTEYSKSIDKGRILTQDPLPGRLIIKNGELLITISGGSREDALAAGELSLPDLTYMSVAQALYELQLSGYRGTVIYEYSDTVAEGLVLSWEINDSTVTLMVSAGKEAGKEEIGDLRGPLMYLDENGEAVLSFAAAAAKIGENFGDMQGDILTHVLYYSADDGKSFKRIEPDSDLSGPSTPWNEFGLGEYTLREGETVPTQMIYIESYLMAKRPDLSGKTLRFKLERWRQEDYGSPFVDDVLPMDVIEFPQSLTMKIEGEPVSITGIQMAEEEDSYLLEGDFQEGLYYGFAESFDRKQGSICQEAGSLTVRKETSEETFTLKVREVWASEIEESGNFIASGRPMGSILWTEGSGQKPLTEGASIFEALEANDRLWINEYSYRYAYSQLVPDGYLNQVIRSDTDFAFEVSVGPEEAEGETDGDVLRAPMLAQTGDNFYINFMTVIQNPKDAFYDAVLSVSTDAGESFEVIAEEKCYAGQSGMERGQIVVGPLFTIDRVDLQGKEVNFLLELYDEGKLVGSRRLTETYIWNEVEEAVALEELTELSPEEMDEKIGEGVLTEKNSRVYEQYGTYLYNKEVASGTEHEYHFLSLKGNFKKGKTYIIKMKQESVDSSQITYCEKEGEVLAAMSSYEAEVTNQVLIGVSDYEVSRSGRIKHFAGPLTDITSLVPEF